MGKPPPTSFEPDVALCSLSYHSNTEIVVCMSFVNRQAGLPQRVDCLAPKVGNSIKCLTLPKKKTNTVGFVGFLKYNKTCLSSKSGPAKFTSTQVKLSTSCRITNPMYHILHSMNHLDLSSITYFSHCFVSF